MSLSVWGLVVQRGRGAGGTREESDFGGEYQAGKELRVNRERDMRIQGRVGQRVVVLRETSINLIWE